MFRAQCWGPQAVAPRPSPWLGGRARVRIQTCCWPCPRPPVHFCMNKQPFLLVKWTPGSLCFLNPVVTAEEKAEQQLLAGNKFETTVALNPSWVFF